MQTSLPWLSLLIATALALWVYRLGERVKEATQRAFEVIEFAGKRYKSVDITEKHLEIRLRALFKEIKGQHEGVILKNQEPIIALLPMEEFLRLKGLEEYLDDRAIATLIEERLANRDRTQRHPLRDFDGFRKILYQEEDQDNTDCSKKEVDNVR